MPSSYNVLFIQVAFFILIFQKVYAQVDPINDRIAYAKSVLDEGLKNNDSVKIAEGYYLLAKRMIDINNIEDSYIFFYKSMKINEKLKDYNNIGRIYMRLAEMEHYNGNIEAAEEFLNEAAKIYKVAKIKNISERTLFTASLIQSPHISDYKFYKKSHLDSILTIFKIREKIAIQKNKIMDLASIRFQIGNIYKAKKDKKALYYLQSSVDLNRKDSLVRPNILYRSGLADALIFFGKTGQAKVILEESRKIKDAGHSQPPSVISKYHEAYSAYYTAVKDWKNAYTFKDSAAKYYIKIIENDRNGNVSKWRVQLETDKKDLELKLQKQEIKNKERLISQQQTFVIIVFFLLLCLALLSYFLYKNFKRQKSLTEKNAILIHEQNHRVKNNLQVISSLLNLQNDYVKDDKSRQVLSESQSRIDAMALLHRQLYENDQVESINIENLFYDIVHSVGQTFGTKSLNLDLSMDVTSLNPDIATSLGLIINELAINSFKYAFENRNPTIKITSWKSSNNINITYQDYGKTDFSHVFNDSNKKGFGMTLIDMIVFQINGSIRYDFLNNSAITLCFKNV